MVTTKPCVLLVDQDDYDLHATARSLRHQPFAVYTARTVAEAVSILSEESVAAIVCDVKSVSDEDGDLRVWTAKHHPQIEWIILTQEGSVVPAEVAAGNSPTAAYVARPCHIERLTQAIRTVLESGGALECEVDVVYAS